MRASGSGSADALGQVHGRAPRRVVGPIAPQVQLAPPAPPSALAVSSTRNDAQGYLDFLQIVARHTGGKAIINTNDFAPGLDQIFRETSHYYLIGYETEAASGFRRLDISVRRPGAEALSERTYFRHEAAPAGPGLATAPSLDDAVSRLMPAGDLPMRATLAAFAPEPAHGNVAVVFAVGDARQSAPAALDALVRVFTPEGQPVLTRPLQVTASTEVAEATREVVAALALGPGRYDVRVAARDPRTGDVGSVYASVEVPDFRRLPVGLSDVVFERRREGGGVAGDLVDLPVRPTTDRSFEAGDAVRVFLRAYASPPAPVSASATILDRSGATRVTVPLDLTPRPGDSRRREYDIVYVLPTHVLEPGPYLLRVAATSGTESATRERRFTVR